MIDSRTSGQFLRDAYGVQNNVITATAEDAEHTSTFAGYLKASALRYGALMTLIQIVDVVAGEGADVVLDVGGARKYFHLATGRHTLSMPFVYLKDSGQPDPSCDSYAYTVKIRGKRGVAKVGRHLLVEGLARYAGVVLVLEGSQAPAAYAGAIGCDSGYFRGDMNYRTNVAAGGPWGDFCTTAGTPGRWKATAGLAAWGAGVRLFSVAGCAHPIGIGRSKSLSSFRTGSQRSGVLG